MTAGLALGTPRLMLGAGPGQDGPNDAVNVAVIGLGSTKAVGGVGVPGDQLIGRLREVPGVNIVTLCDADQARIDREVEAARGHGGKVAAYRDPREVFDDKGVDAGAFALPNDLGCGPAPKKSLMRKRLHYEWRWFWDTGNGETGNNGVHVIDVCRCAPDRNGRPRAP